MADAEIDRRVELGIVELRRARPSRRCRAAPRRARRRSRRRTRARGSGRCPGRWWRSAARGCPRRGTPASGTMPARASSGSASSRMRPLGTAMMMRLGHGGGALLGRVRVAQQRATEVAMATKQTNRDGVPHPGRLLRGDGRADHRAACARRSPTGSTRDSATGRARARLAGRADRAMRCRCGWSAGCTRWHRRGADAGAGARSSRAR